MVAGAATRQRQSEVMDSASVIGGGGGNNSSFKPGDDRKDIGGAGGGDPESGSGSGGAGTSDSGTKTGGGWRQTLRASWRRCVAPHLRDVRVQLVLGCVVLFIGNALAAAANAASQQASRSPVVEAVRVWWGPCTS
jgi:hypothetical protein